MFQLMITERLRAEYRDFDVDYPMWLETIVDDELYYTITVITVCVNSFGLGLCIGWLCSL
jgi:hypothetical protein